MKRTLFVPLLLVLFLPGYSKASNEVTVKGFRYWSSESYTRVVIDVDRPVKFTQNRLSDPDRLYFDLSNCRLSKKTKPVVPVGDRILKKIRAGQLKNEVVRVVLDLQEFQTFNVFTLKDPHRVVIDVFGNRVEKSVLTLNSEERKRLEGIKRVVIDPGHGGKDPGAIGPNRLKEKDVVLAVAKKLGKILKEKHNIEVIFTRDRDVFIPLEERTAIANSKKADLFISIHANASRRRKARGIETYFLNWTNNREAIRVAARENAISVDKMKQAQDELQMILRDLARDNKKDESMKLAYNVQNSMVDSLSRDYKRVIDLGVKQALFYVLVGARMPSILIEVSFISNYEEEKRLAGKRYKDRIAEAIAKGVNRYTAPSKLAKRYQ
ncbi:MAG TPA: N-acetylmuramoyl-L-alanine amidase [Nitrospirae bacterium]|nr:N-acetylmuramoyl-L-alanine amidase AmiC precursor [bacterium BMS3Abin10]GBE39393.1 N-acetylmuramoyl-L-alanine amidase AmiC precursor [bacterium BMS3Bbin08]HDH50966.1 N-acetylmuramoyl-L-alanine amidase [Nitrospirota bacterium]HDK81179.1 N-acetylmuramoyl-L-alanine amidase [Nitrospirota bacterium]